MRWKIVSVVGTGGLWCRWYLAGLLVNVFGGFLPINRGFIMTWVLFIEDMDNGNDIVTYLTEVDAMKAAAIEIVNRVEEIGFDYGDEDYDLAVDINNYINQGDYKEVIRLWNKQQDNYNAPTYFIINEHKELVINTNVPLIQLPDPPEEDDEETAFEDDEDDKSYLQQQYVASTPGATCRGGCGQYFPDAYADQHDGTIECYQCRTFKKVFGGS